MVPLEEHRKVFRIHLLRSWSRPAGADHLRDGFAAGALTQPQECQSRPGFRDGFRFSGFNYRRIVGKKSGVSTISTTKNNYMNHMRLLMVLAVSLLAPCMSVFAGVKNSDCLDCHGDNTLIKTNS